MELEVKDSTQRILDVAEALFMDRGYSAITLRDIADELGIKQASLYYHFPAGKEQIFVAMAERLFERHREGLETALHDAESNLNVHSCMRLPTGSVRSHRSRFWACFTPISRL